VRVDDHAAQREGNSFHVLGVVEFDPADGLDVAVAGSLNVESN
jgi:hypothetical protein